MSAYVNELNRRVEGERSRREADQKAQASAVVAAVREKLVPLDDRVARLLTGLPSEVQREGLSLQSLHVQLRGRGRGHSRCHVGELGDALRRLGYRRERRWRGGAGSFCALWYPPATLT